MGMDLDCRCGNPLAYIGVHKEMKENWRDRMDAKLLGLNQEYPFLGLTAQTQTGWTTIFSNGKHVFAERKYKHVYERLETFSMAFHIALEFFQDGTMWIDENKKVRISPSRMKPKSLWGLVKDLSDSI